MAGQFASKYEMNKYEVVGVVGVLLSDDLFPAEMRLRGSDAAYVTNLAVASRARRVRTDTCMG